MKTSLEKPNVPLTVAETPTEYHLDVDLKQTQLMQDVQKTHVAREEAIDGVHVHYEAATRVQQIDQMNFLGRLAHRGEKRAMEEHVSPVLYNEYRQQGGQMASVPVTKASHDLTSANRAFDAAENSVANFTQEPGVMGKLYDNAVAMGNQAYVDGKIKQPIQTPQVVAEHAANAAALSAELTPPEAPTVQSLTLVNTRVGAGPSLETAMENSRAAGENFRSGHREI